MKRLPVVILLVVALLVTVVAGCGGMRRHDARLAAADSLMQSDPDSALSIVEGVCRDSLANEGDRAYRDLLLTQARYRCYIPATSDSDISRALAWYRVHDGEREKLTRALIYKGAVMEELSRPDSAMLYYKQAEATAAPDDYFNLGYVKMRIGEIYQNQLPQDSAGIVRLLEARRYFTQLNDTNYLIVTLGKLGAISGIRCVDSAKLYLKQAISLAQRFRPTMQYTYKSKLAGVYLYENNLTLANQLAMDVLLNGRDYSDEEQYIYYAAFSFLKLGKVDSAIWVVRQFALPCNAIDSMNYWNIMAEISKAEGKSNEVARYLALSKEITARILSSKNQKTATLNEMVIDKRILANKNASSRQLIILLCVLMSCFMLLLAAMIIRYFSHKKEMVLIRHELEITLSKLNEQHRQSVSGRVSQLLEYRMSAIEELYHDIRIKIQDEKRAKKIVPLSSIFSSLSERNEILKIQPSDTFWEKVRISVDGEYNNIVSFVEQNYPKLSARDINVFCLFCANFPPHIIRLCLNFANVRSVSNYKNRLIKNKMGLDVSLERFIQSYMKGNLN